MRFESSPDICGFTVPLAYFNIIFVFYFLSEGSTDKTREND